MHPTPPLLPHAPHPIPPASELPQEPTTQEEANAYVDRTVLKYFQPVPMLNYPGGNAAGLVAEAQPLTEQHEQQQQQQATTQFRFLVK
jgi:hypothetical protein